jgi:hypothetical protein
MPAIRGTFDFFAAIDGGFGYQYLDSEFPSFVGIQGTRGQSSSVLVLGVSLSSVTRITAFFKDDSKIPSAQSLLPTGLYRFQGPDHRAEKDKTAVINGVTVSVPVRTAIVKAGACGPNEDNSLAAQIFGSLFLSGRAVSSDVSPSEDTGPIYAFLYEGSAPDTSSPSLLVGIAAVGADGRYAFKSVPAGEYHIVFRGPDLSADTFLSVTASAAGPVEVPATSASITARNDSGCEVISAFPRLTSVNNTLVAAKEYLNGTVDKERIRLSNIKKPKRADIKRIEALGALRDRSTRAAALGLGVITSYPLVIRQSCPAANQCTAQSLKDVVSVVSKSTNNLKKTAAQYFNPLIRKAKSNAKAAKTRRQNRKMQSLLAKVVKSGKALPASNEICPAI